MIGRQHEQRLLDKALKSAEAQLIAVYGRRRVGKTFLVREFFTARKCRLMQATGLQKGALRQQLANFTQAMAAAFLPGVELATPPSWMDAFKQLTTLIANAGDKKTVIFLDEFPWMATRRSGLLQALDFYWNRHWSTMPNLIVVVCGSSASWLIKNIIYNKGGLHNRITSDIRLDPFSLAETIELLADRKLRLGNRQVLALYMAVGGIPYYLNYLERDLSVEQNIQQLFFERNAPLRDEFTKLFSSLFNNAPAYVELVKLIGAKREGMSRADLGASAKLSPGGGQLSERLGDLRAAGFIEEMIPWNRSKGEYYKLVDEFSLFHQRWVEPVRNKRVGKEYWTSQSGKPAYKAWAGYAFENVCLGHIDQILAALRAPAGSIVSSWRFVPRTRNENGTQIDLLIDRTDDAITLCEIKYTATPFTIDKSYATSLRNRLAVFREKTGTNKQLLLAMIAAGGLKRNAYSNELISAAVTAEDLCK
jgi:hypothetical protein